MESGNRDRLRLTHQVEHDGLIGAVFTAKVLERGDHEVRRDGWATSARNLPSLGEPLFHSTVGGGDAVVVEVGEVLVQIHLISGNVYLVAAARSAEADRGVARATAKGVARSRSEFLARGNRDLLDVRTPRPDAVVAVNRRAGLGRDP
jgi:hypothetical protein